MWSGIVFPTEQIAAQGIDLFMTLGIPILLLVGGISVFGAILFIIVAALRMLLFSR